jgi:hypothetical protein
MSNSQRSNRFIFKNITDQTLFEINSKLSSNVASFLGSGSITIPTVDIVNRPETPDIVMIRYNAALSSL